MESLAEILDLIVDQGPWLLFLLALLETSFVWGFFIPTGAALSLAAALVFDEGGSIPVLAAAAMTGGAIGDSVGYWIGRRGRERWADGSGRIARMVGWAHARTSHYFGRRPFLSVTVPRLISFVRTVMPLAAGMSGITYGRFLKYELPGVVLWCALYMTAGLGAGEGWRLAENVFGVDGAVILVAITIAAVFIVRRRAHRDQAHR